jgi:small subunit ribosomal protein S21
MIIIDVDKSGGIENALRKLKRKFDDSGVKQDLRDRREFVKPSIKKRVEKRKAIYIEQKWKNID